MPKRAVFKQILAVSGLAGMEDRILIRASAETANAEAFIEKTADKEERLIFYNAVFMQEIAKKTKDYWSMIAILAHEVGHHIRLHTLIPGRDHEFELEADYQAGFILRRMGATLEQAQTAFRAIGTDVATRTHPAKAQRVQMATLGWMEGGSQPLPLLGPEKRRDAEKTSDPAKVAALPKIDKPGGSHQFDGTWTITWEASGCGLVPGIHGSQGSRKLTIQAGTIVNGQNASLSASGVIRWYNGALGATSQAHCAEIPAPAGSLLIGMRAWEHGTPRGVDALPP